jgi:hypothetical protein
MEYNDLSEKYGPDFAEEYGEFTDPLLLQCMYHVRLKWSCTADAEYMC